MDFMDLYSGLIVRVGNHTNNYLHAAKMGSIAEWERVCQIASDGVPYREYLYGQHSEWLACIRSLLCSVMIGWRTPLPNAAYLPDLSRAYFAKRNDRSANRQTNSNQFYRFFHQKW